MNIEMENNKECLLAVASAALETADTMPVTRLTRVYQGVALMLRETSPAEAASAQRVCDSLKAAEASQMTFVELLRAS
jgi:hypothetical protein